METKKMTAAELHALYAPLWELVPETRPANVRLHTAGGWLEEYPHPTILGGKLFASLTDSTLAALCRVSVEDWLRANTLYLMMSEDKPYEPAGDESSVQLDGRWMGGDYCEAEDVTDIYGPTIHHALVAAAMAVKKAVGK